MKGELTKAVRDIAEQVIGGDYYSVDDDGGRASRVSVDWPWALASTALTSLPDTDEAGLRHLEALCERIDRCNWATLWEDPGVYPSNAGGSALPSRYDPAPEVHALADAVREEIEAIRERLQGDQS